MRKFYLPWGLVIVFLLSAFVLRPLFISGFFPMHDDTQPARVYEMGKALKDGMFPVRWSADLGYGYGYPLFNFYGPFAYYIGGFFNVIGLDALSATKVMIVIGMLVAGISMYLLGETLWGTAGGLLAGIFYLFAPYHALELYVRGDIAELYAYGLIPFVFLGLYKIYENSKLKSQNSKLELKTKKYIWLWITEVAFSYAAVIASHNLTAMMITPFITVFLLGLIICGIKRKNYAVSKPLLIAFFIGILLAAVYWLPVLVGMKNTNVMSQVGGSADYHLHFVCPIQIWDSPWGFGGSAAGCLDGMSFRLGKLHILVALLTMFGLVFAWKKAKRDRYLILGSFVLLLVSLFFMLQVSQPIWDKLSTMSFLQYPWRFLVPASFFSSFLAGALTYIVPLLLPKEKQLLAIKILVACGIIGCIFLYTKLFNPQTIEPKTAADYTSDLNLKWNISKISDEYMPKDFIKPQYPQDIVHDKFVVESGDATIHDVHVKTQEMSAVIDSKDTAKILIKTAFFPTWHIYLNNASSAYDISDNGLVANVPPGRTLLRLLYKESYMQVFGNFLSLTGMLMLIIGIIRSMKVPGLRKKGSG